jgi:signal transduction histidine kinase
MDAQAFRPAWRTLCMRILPVDGNLGDSGTRVRCVAELKVSPAMKKSTRPQKRRPLTLRKAQQQLSLERELQRVNRALRATTVCAQVIVHAESEPAMLEQICRVIVEAGGYRMAWIGFAEDDEQKTVRPVAVAGYDEGYVAAAKVSWADTERGRGPTGTAIREGVPVICRNMFSDEKFAPWRAPALQRGYASSIVIPLRYRERTYGALSIYAAEPDAFHESEVKWLLPQGEDIGFGITAQRTRLERERADAALRRTQSLLNITQRISKVGGWEYDVLEGRGTWTEEVYRIYGVAPGELNLTHPDTALSYYQPPYRQMVADAFRRAIEEGAPYDIEAQFVSAKNEKLWVRTLGQVEWKDGRVVRVFGNIADVTERNRVERALRLLNVELERRVADRTHELNDRMSELQTILDTAPIGLALASTPDGKHIRGNAALERMLSLNTGQELSLRSAQPFQIFSEGKELRVEELPMQRAVRGETVSGQQLCLGVSGGRWVDVYCNAATLYDQEGRPRGAVGAFLDITSLKNAETALRLSELRFRTIYDTAPVSIWQEDWADVYRQIQELRAAGVTDWPRYFNEHPEFVQSALDSVKVLDVNHWTLRMFGARDKKELLASLRTIFATPDTLRGFVGEIIALAQGQASFTTEMMLNTVNGGVIHGLLGMTFPQEPAMTNVLISVVDITERKEAEANLQRMASELLVANKELESFAYSVSHDLRAPLRAIDGFGRIVLRDCSEVLGERGRDNLERIRGATQRMGLLIDSLLDLSRTVRADIHRRSLDLAPLARAIAAELERAEPARKVQWDIAPELPAFADPVLIGTALQNLLGNAWKFTSHRADARICFDITKSGAEQVYRVSDNGDGFDMTYAERLFTPFQRLHTQEEFAGTGIGLATVERIIQRHGGRIWAVGEKDFGATFYFTLPQNPPPRT